LDDEIKGSMEFNAAVNLNACAVLVIRACGDVFCGFGAYSVQEVFFYACKLIY
jgi:hypothetical protein